jgi:NitT/TauT family transport system ATP-binding protein
MKMRCSLARSLVSQPQVFLFDEPFGALDEMTREHLNDELLNIFSQENFAGLFITHSIQEAVFLSTRVIVMSSQPGRFISEHTIDFSFPRQPDIRYSAKFAELCGRISHDLKSAHS